MKHSTKVDEKMIIKKIFEGLQKNIRKFAGVLQLLTKFLCLCFDMCFIQNEKNTIAIKLVQY